MKAIILAGGKGTRLHPLTSTTPKPLIPVCGRPVLGYTFDALYRAGVRECAITIRPDDRDTFTFAGAAPMPVQVVTEPEPRGTAGCLHALADFIDQTTLILPGDVLFDFDLAAALAFHRDRRAEASLLLTRVDSPTAYGLTRTDKKGRILSFREKPDWNQVITDTVSSGLYLIEPSVLGRIPRDRFYDFGRDLFPAMLRDGADLYATVANGYWCDIGSIPSLLSATRDLLDGKHTGFTPPEIPDLPGIHLHPPVLLGKGVSLAAGCVIGPYTVLGDGCTVEDAVELSGCILGKRCHIGTGTHARDLICLDDTALPSNARPARYTALTPSLAATTHTVIAPQGRAHAMAALCECGEDFDEADGLTFTRHGGHVCIRPADTPDRLLLRATAPTLEAAEEICREIEELL